MGGDRGEGVSNKRYFVISKELCSHIGILKKKKKRFRLYKTFDADCAEFRFLNSLPGFPDASGKVYLK